MVKMRAGFSPNPPGSSRVCQYFMLFPEHVTDDIPNRVAFPVRFKDAECLPVTCRPFVRFQHDYFRCDIDRGLDGQQHRMKYHILRVAVGLEPGLPGSFCIAPNPPGSLPIPECIPPGGSYGHPKKIRPVNPVKQVFQVEIPRG